MSMFRSIRLKPQRIALKEILPTKGKHGLLNWLHSQRIMQKPVTTQLPYSVG
jgi:hypothetical protein